MNLWYGVMWVHLTNEKWYIAIYIYIYLYYIMRGHVTNKKWYNSTYSKLIIAKQDRCVTCSVKRPLKGEWSLSQVFFWGQVINETLYILTLTTKHERLMLKIGTNWCSKFIKRYEIYNLQETTFNLFAEFILCISLTECMFEKIYFT